MSTLSVIRDAINTKLQTLTGVGQPVAYVYDHFKMKVEGFPAIAFEPERMDTEFEDTCNNMRAYKFTILIMQELKNMSRSTSLNNLESIFDAVINLFDDDRTLGGLCEGEITPTSGEFDTIEGKDGAMMICTIQLTCKTLYNFS